MRHEHVAASPDFFSFATLLLLFLLLFPFPLPATKVAGQKQCNEPTMMMAVGCCLFLAGSKYCSGSHKSSIKSLLSIDIYKYIYLYVCIYIRVGMAKPKAKAAFVLILQTVQTVFCACLGTTNTKSKKSQKMATKIAIDFGVWFAICLSSCSCSYWLVAVLWRCAIGWSIIILRPPIICSLFMFFPFRFAHENCQGIRMGRLENPGRLKCCKYALEIFFNICLIF